MKLSPAAIVADRAHTINDYRYPLGQPWLYQINPTDASIYFLGSVAGNQATWLLAGGPGDFVQTLTGNSGGAVGPDLSDNINLVGTGGVTVAGNPGTNTLTISGGGGGSFTWSSISSSQPLAINNGYFCVSPGGALSLTLPATSSVGSIIEISF